MLWPSTAAGGSLRPVPVPARRARCRILSSRFASDGTLDTSLNGTGFVTTDFAGGYDSASSVRVSAGGKILATGLRSAPTTGAILPWPATTSMALWTPPSIRRNGHDRFCWADDRGAALAVDANGAAFVAGTSSVQSGDNWA